MPTQTPQPPLTPLPTPLTATHIPPFVPLSHRSGLAGTDLRPMSLGLSHSLSRYKLKFSPDKVDTMIVQAIGLLDDLDKELNTYAMRVREWYGWHFPEMTKIATDNIQYAKAVVFMGTRDQAQGLDFSGILEEDVEGQLKAAAQVSMGTDISEADLDNIKDLANQVRSVGSGASEAERGDGGKRMGYPSTTEPPGWRAVRRCSHWSLPTYVTALKLSACLLANYVPHTRNAPV